MRPLSWGRGSYKIALEVKALDIIFLGVAYCKID